MNTLILTNIKQVISDYFFASCLIFISYIGMEIFLICENRVTHKAHFINTLVFALLLFFNIVYCFIYINSLEYS